MGGPALPAGPYDVILADPPWAFQTWSARGGGRSAKRYYPTLQTDVIGDLPVSSIAASESVLFLWSIFTRLPDALEVIKRWGFTYRTVAFVWVKTNADGSPFMGLGYYTRQNAEVCLLAIRGHRRTAASPLRRVAADVRSVILAPRREHSRKPDEQYERIRRLFGPDVRRIELFARPPHQPGWDVWGLEAKPAGPNGYAALGHLPNNVVS